MNADLVILLVAAVTTAASLAVAGFYYGLFLGERGRRQAAEAMLVLGTPDPKPAGRITMQNAPLLEPKLAPKGWDKATLEKGADSIAAEAKRAGVPLSRDQALAMSEDMLTQAVYGGGEDDVTLG